MNIQFALDQQYARYLEKNQDMNDRWLLQQNVALTQTRRNILNALDFRTGQQILDLGCGFGILALDLAASTPVDVYAVDVDATKLNAAAELTGAIIQTLGHLPGNISFKQSDAYKLEFENDKFDWVISQHVFQHLEFPHQVVEEIYRVTKPGGNVCLIDVDDGLSASYPEQDSFQRLSSVMEEVQSNQGGDRHVGRKLPFLLHEAGFEVTSTVPIVQSGFLSAEESARMAAVVGQHIADYRDSAVARGLIEAQEFDRLLDDFIHNPLPFTFEADTRFVVMGQKA